MVGGETLLITQQGYIFYIYLIIISINRQLSPITGGEWIHIYFFIYMYIFFTIKASSGESNQTSIPKSSVKRQEIYSGSILSFEPPWIFNAGLQKPYEMYLHSLIYPQMSWNSGIF